MKTNRRDWNIDRIVSRVIGIAILLAGIGYFFSAPSSRMK